MQISVFPVFQNMGMHIQIAFLWQIFKNYIFLGSNNKQPVAMAAMLNKKFPPLRF